MTIDAGSSVQSYAVDVACFFNKNILPLSLLTMSCAEMAYRNMIHGEPLSPNIKDTHVPVKIATD